MKIRLKKNSLKKDYNKRRYVSKKMNNIKMESRKISDDSLLKNQILPLSLRITLQKKNNIINYCDKTQISDMLYGADIESTKRPRTAHHLHPHPSSGPLLQSGAAGHKVDILSLYKNKDKNVLNNSVVPKPLFSIIRNRCLVTGRGRGNIVKMGISRIVFRKWADNGYIPGIVSHN